MVHIKQLDKPDLGHIKMNCDDTISTDTLRTFTTILPMNKDEYFKIVLTTFVGNAVMRFEGMQYSSMKIMLLG